VADNVPKVQAVDETLVFLLSSSPVNLMHLAETIGSVNSDRSNLSNLEKLTRSIMLGDYRHLDKEVAIADIQFDIVQVLHCAE